MPEACPPPDSEPGQGVFYRLGEKHLKVGDVPGKGTWRKPYKAKGPNYGRSDVCEAHAFSIFESLNSIQGAREISPWAAGKSLARVEVSPEMGNLLETQSIADSHYEWWSNPYNLIPESVVIDEARELS